MTTRRYSEPDYPTLTNQQLRLLRDYGNTSRVRNAARRELRSREERRARDKQQTQQVTA